MVRAERRIAIRGVLEGDPGGVGGDDGWDLVFYLRPWREGASEVNTDRMRVLLSVGDHAALHRHMKALDGGMLVSIMVQKLARPDRKRPWWVAHALSYRRIQKDVRLQDARAVLDKPVIIDDADLGKLTLDRRYDQFRGQRRFRGATYDISIARTSKAVSDELSDKRDVERGRRVIARFEHGMRDLYDAIVRKMLPLYNDNWRGTRRVISGDRLIARIKLSSADVWPGSRTTLYFSDGGLFHDHVIEVRLRPNGRVSEICLAG